MAIKTTVNPPTKMVKSFPKLMKSTECGRVVLFTSEREGTVVIDNIPITTPIGHYSNSWISSYYKDFNDPITLQNK